MMNAPQFEQLLNDHRDEIAEKMRSAYKMVLNSDGLMQSEIYIDERDGEVIALDDTQGSNWRYMSECMRRIAIIDEPGLDRDIYRYDPSTTDDEIDEWLLSEFDTDDLIDLAISDAYEIDRLNGVYYDD